MFKGFTTADEHGRHVAMLTDGTRNWRIDPLGRPASFSRNRPDIAETLANGHAAIANRTGDLSALPNVVQL